jgi:hypothetical protein
VPTVPARCDAYGRLITVGEARKLALTAAMRKLPVILNAMLRNCQGTPHDRLEQPRRLRTPFHDHRRLIGAMRLRRYACI